MYKKEKTYIVEYLLLLGLFMLIPTLITSMKFIFGSEINKIDINSSPKLSLYVTSSSKIIELPLEEYVIGVVASEMPSSFHLEALKAQAVAARTYAYVRISNNYEKEREAHFGAVMCSDPAHCQAYISKERFLEIGGKGAEKKWNKITKAVLETYGEIIEYEQKPINPLYHANSGGVTEDAAEVWTNADVPYLRSVYSEGEDEYNSYESKLIFPPIDIENKFKKFYSDIQIDSDNFENEIEIKEYTTSGRIKKIRVGNRIVEGTRFREALELKSTYFNIEFIDSKLLITVYGFGHGVGLSQCGADSLAEKDGKNYTEIICHYYTNVEIRKIY